MPWHKKCCKLVRPKNFKKSEKFNKCITNKTVFEIHLFTFFFMNNWIHFLMSIIFFVCNIIFFITKPPHMNFRKWSQLFVSQNLRCLFLRLLNSSISCLFTNIRLLIKIFCFSSNFDETLWDCSTHGYYNLTKFCQNQMRNKIFLLIA